jgi:protein-tyrosine phosphatase
MPSLLFVCSANRFRSPLAEAFFKKNLELDGIFKGWNVSSAGIWTERGLPPLPPIQKAAKELGMNIDSHRSQQVSLTLLLRQDLILVMEAGHKESLQIEFPNQASKVYLLSEVVDGLTYDIPDLMSNHGKSDLDVIQELYKIIFRGYKIIFQLAKKNSEANKTHDL